MSNTFNIEQCVSFCFNNMSKKEVKRRLGIIKYIKNYGYQGEELLATILMRGILKNNKEGDSEKIEEEILKISNEKVLNSLKDLERKKDEDEVSYLERIKTLSRVSKNAEFFYRFFYIKENQDLTNKVFLNFVKNTLNYCMNFIKNSMLKEELVEIINKIFERSDPKRVSSEEEKIKRICRRYKFSYKYVHHICFITSKFDRWYFEYYPNISTIKLYHQNRKFSTNDYHFQRKFTEKQATIENVIRYIKKHDDYLLYKKYDYTKIDRLLATTNSYS